MVTLSNGLTFVKGFLILFFLSPYQEIRPGKGANGLAQMVISSGRLSQPLFSEKERIILLTI